MEPRVKKQKNKFRKKGFANIVSDKKKINNNNNNNNWRK